MSLRLGLLLLLSIGFVGGCSTFNDSTLGQYYQGCELYGDYYGVVCDTESHGPGSKMVAEQPEQRDYPAEIDALNSKLSDRDNEIDRLRSDLQNARQQVADKERALREKDQALAELQSNQAGYQNSESENAGLQQELSERERRIAALESEKDRFAQQVSERDATIASLKAGQSDRAANDGERAQFVKDLADKDAELARLRAQLDAQETELNQLRDQVAALEHEKAQLRASLSDKETAFAGLQGQQGTMSQLEEDKTRLRQDIADREAEIARLQAALKTQEDSKASLSQQVADQETALHTLQGKHDALAAQLDSEIANVTQVHKDLFQLLKPEIEKGNIKIEQAGNQLTINMADRLLFDSGQAQLNKEGAQVLRKVGGILKRVSNQRIKVQGHTDNVPIRGRLKKRFPSNLALSQERAANAAQWLQEGGVDSNQLTTEGYGETKPVASNQLAEGRQKNRRVDIVVSN